jgi:hypothetical protein
VQDANVNYLEIKRLKNVFFDLVETFKQEKDNVLGNGEKNFYQKQLLQKQGEWNVLYGK